MQCSAGISECLKMHGELLSSWENVLIDWESGSVLVLQPDTPIIRERKLTSGFTFHGSSDTCSSHFTVATAHNTFALEMKKSRKE